MFIHLTRGRSKKHSSHCFFFQPTEIHEQWLLGKPPPPCPTRQLVQAVHVGFNVFFHCQLEGAIECVNLSIVVLHGLNGALPLVHQCHILKGPCMEASSILSEGQIHTGQCLVNSVWAWGRKKIFAKPSLVHGKRVILPPPVVQLANI